MNTKLKDKLTHKQFLFVQGIISGLTQTEAARQAGYGNNNPTDNYLAYIGNKCIRNNKIKQAIEANNAKIAKKYEVTAEKVIAELAKVGFSNIKSFIESGNEITDISELTPELAAAVESVQSDIRHDSGNSKGYTEKVKIKLYSKLGALNSLAEILKIKDVSGNVEIKILNVQGLNQLEA